VPERTVRVRLLGERAFLTVKGPTAGASRAEFEYAIPPDDARAMLDLCEKPLIEKTRYVVPHGGLVWEIDEFHGANAGLVVAECELASEDQPLDKPDWVGEEVTGDARYYNSSLVARPFSTW
jgi:adenylate cyclase